MLQADPLARRLSRVRHEPDRRSIGQFVRRRRIGRRTLSAAAADWDHDRRCSQCPDLSSFQVLGSVACCNTSLSHQVSLGSQAGQHCELVSDRKCGSRRCEVTQHRQMYRVVVLTDRRPVGNQPGTPAPCRPEPVVPARTIHRQGIAGDKVDQIGRLGDLIEPCVQKWLQSGNPSPPHPHRILHEDELGGHTVTEAWGGGDQTKEHGRRPPAAAVRRLVSRWPLAGCLALLAYGISSPSGPPPGRARQQRRIGTDLLPLPQPADEVLVVRVERICPPRRRRRADVAFAIGRSASRTRGSASSRSSASGSCQYAASLTESATASVTVSSSMSSVCTGTAASASARADRPGRRSGRRSRRGTRSSRRRPRPDSSLDCGS
jgi:hypothetical protein